MAPKILTTAQVAEVAKALSGNELSPKTLHAWDKAGVLSPTIQTARGTGTRRHYSMEDTVIALVLQRLSQRGISRNLMGEAAGSLRGWFRTRGPRPRQTFVLCLRGEHQPSGEDSVALQQGDDWVKWVKSGFADVVVNVTSIEKEVGSHPAGMDRNKVIH